MKGRSVSELLCGMSYRVIYPSGSGQMISGEITDVTDRASEVTRGGAFVCIKGMHTDGHAYAWEAVRRGAALLVCENGEGEGVIDAIRGEAREITASSGITERDGADIGGARSDPLVIEVEDTRSALSVICARYYGLDRRCPRLICVTGTNGKTTVSTLICRALTDCGRRAALLGTLGGELDGERYDSGGLTTPDPKRLCELLARFADGGAEFVVMEASSHALALRKLDGLEPEIAIFTNLTPEHLDIHKDMEGYACAKSRLFRMCRLGIVWSDDAYADRMLASLPSDAVGRRCSSSDKSAEYLAVNVRSLGERGVKYDALRGNSPRYSGGKGASCVERTEMFSSVPGSFSVPNTLLAFAVLCELGIDARLSAEAISAQGGVVGRMERVELPGDVGYSVYIDFAHTPDALAKLISSVRGFARDGQRIVVLFGCGGDRDRSKRSLMGAIASRMADLVIMTSDNCRGEDAEDIIAEILTGVDTSRPYTVIVDRRKAIEYAVANAGEGDIILLCGKGHEQYELRGGERYPFCEREIVMEAAKRRIAAARAECDGGDALS